MSDDVAADIAQDVLEELSNLHDRLEWLVEQMTALREVAYERGQTSAGYMLQHMCRELDLLMESGPGLIAFLRDKSTPNGDESRPVDSNGPPV